MSTDGVTTVLLIIVCFPSFSTRSACNRQDEDGLQTSVRISPRRCRCCSRSSLPLSPVHPARSTPSEPSSGSTNSLASPNPSLTLALTLALTLKSTRGQRWDRGERRLAEGAVDSVPLLTLQKLSKGGTFTPGAAVHSVAGCRVVSTFYVLEVRGGMPRPTFANAQFGESSSFIYACTSQCDHCTLVDATCIVHMCFTRA